MLQLLTQLQSGRNAAVAAYPSHTQTQFAFLYKETQLN